MKISNKIHFFIPTSFDKFFETGKFEKKTNSVLFRSRKILYFFTDDFI